MSPHTNKKLIILDGWRDRVYFNKIIEIFYDKGYLDVLVRFQATLSTRRINLEARERSLEGVRNHIVLLENPAIEDTSLYREGEVLICNLDN